MSRRADRSRRTDWSRRAPAQGFTLVELILLIALIGILAWLAVPRLGAFHEIKLDTAARRVAADLRYAQGLSMTRRERHGVLFEPAVSRYTVLDAASRTPVENPMDRGRPLLVDFHGSGECQGVSIVSADFGGTPGVTFDFFGVPRDTSGRELATPGQILLSYEGMTAAVAIAPGTGKVSLP